MRWSLPNSCRTASSSRSGALYFSMAASTPGSEHLLEIGSRHPTRRDVVTVRLGAELGVERQRDFCDVDEVVKRALAVLLPGAVLVHFDEALQANMADAGGHAAGLHRQALAMLVPAFDAGEAGDAFLAGAGGAAVEALFVRTGFQAFAVTAATLLVDKDDAVFGALVNGVARAGSEAGGIGAVVTDPRQVKEPRLVTRQYFSAFEVLALHAFLGADGVVLVAVGGGPLFVGRQVAKGLLSALGADIHLGRFEDGLAVELAVRGLSCPRLWRPRFGRPGWRAPADRES